MNSVTIMVVIVVCLACAFGLYAATHVEDDKPDSKKPNQ